MRQEEEKCCGGCCWFHSEDTGGWGFCIKQRGNDSDIMNCSDLCTTDMYNSREQMRHYQSILLQANRYRRDQNVPSIYKMPNPTELGKAIDFACDYIKTFSEL